MGQSFYLMAIKISQDFTVQNSFFQAFFGEEFILPDSPMSFQLFNLEKCLRRGQSSQIRTELACIICRQINSSKCEQSNFFGFGYDLFEFEGSFFSTLIQI